MADLAPAVNSAPSPATSRLRRVRPDGSVVRAGTYPYAGTNLVSGWHRHDLHQIEYAVEGVVQVETALARYLLPPQQAVWIPAGLAHNTTLRDVRTVSVFLDPAMVEGVGDRARVLTVEPVFREMILYAARWPIDRALGDPLADTYFDLLAGLVLRWLEAESPFHLPRSDDPVLAAAMAYTDRHLATLTLAEVCAAAAVSERTLRRRFTTGTGMSWRRYLLRSRLLRAMALLAEGDTTIAGVAAQVGFESSSAFARAFVTYTGQSPSAYRRRT
jgi:AraC-like DNA-binding protein/quercetin dioxygenase-like cupin family protein